MPMDIRKSTVSQRQLILRAYMPRRDIVEQRWTLPPVQPVGSNVRCRALRRAVNLPHQPTWMFV